MIGHKQRGKAPARAADFPDPRFLGDEAALAAVRTQGAALTQVSDATIRATVRAVNAAEAARLGALIDRGAALQRKVAGVLGQVFMGR